MYNWSVEEKGGRLFKNTHTLNGGKKRIAEGRKWNKKEISSFYGPPFSHLSFNVLNEL